MTGTPSQTQEKRTFMELTIILTVLCLATIFAIKLSSWHLSTPDRISGSTLAYSKALIFLFWFIVTFIAAFREGFEDTGVYKTAYEDIGTDYGKANDENNIIPDYGFNVFMIFLNRINSDPQTLIVVTSVIIISAYIYTIQKYSADVPLSLLLFLCTSFFGLINGIRQVLAASVLILALPWLRDRKFIPYAILAWLASALHGSAIVMIPLYFVITGKRLGFRVWLYVGFVGLCFLAPGLATTLMRSLLEDSTYAGYLTVDSQMGIMRAVVAAVPLMVTIAYCNANGLKCNGDNAPPEERKFQRLTDVLMNMQVVSFGFTVLGLRMVYFARMSMYFDCALLLLLPAAIEASFETGSVRHVKFITVVLYLFYFGYQVYSYFNYGSLDAFRLIF